MPRKLEEAKKREILRLLAAGETQASAAEKAGVGVTTVGRVAKSAKKKRGGRRADGEYGAEAGGAIAALTRAERDAVNGDGERALKIAVAVGECMNALREVPFGDHEIVFALAKQWLAQGIV